MKKLTLLLLIYMLFIPGLFAQEYDDNNITSGLDYLEEEGDLVDMGFWIQDRGFEIGFFNFEVYAANNFAALGNVLSKYMKIDTNKMPDILKLNMGLDLFPLYFNVNSKKGWGFGLATELQVSGLMGLNVALFPTITDAKNKKSDFNLGAYINIVPHAYFNIQNFKVSVKPTVYIPVAFAKSNISYTLDSAGGEMNFKYDVSLFTAFDMEVIFENESFSGLTTSPGIDLTISAEYPLSRQLGLDNLIPILNFDVGASLIALPFIPGRLKSVYRVKGYMEADLNDIDFGDLGKIGDLFEFVNEDPEYGTSNQAALRPFAMHLWANWKPLGSELITVTPLLGFGINPLYNRKFALEGGITGHLNLANLFHVIIGMNYLDRMMRNSLDLILNARAFELNLGGDLRSQRYGNSWNGSGFAVRFGMKFGW